MKNLKLLKPLCFIDVETTGLKPSQDRIVELSNLKISPDGSRIYKSHRINPGVPIPPQSTAIHGITDDDVADEPFFRNYAKSIRDFIGDSDLSGFNLIKFDLPFLESEFERSGIDFSHQNRRLIDVQTIFHKKEPRTLEAAYFYYCGKTFDVMHTAEGDATAAAEILDAQLERYSDLPREIDGLHSLCYRVREDYVDPDGKFVWIEGEVCCNFGNKHNGRFLREIVEEDPDYLEWIMEADFSSAVVDLVRKALHGEFPEQQEGK
jgi:DNA polymerase-3 subunit epsilon